LFSFLLLQKQGQEADPDEEERIFTITMMPLEVLVGVKHITTFTARGDVLNVVGEVGYQNL
jgi:hypothetical protein